MKLMIISFAIHAVGVWAKGMDIKDVINYVRGNKPCQLRGLYPNDGPRNC